MKKKWTAIAWTALYMAITFMVQLMLSFAYGMIAFFVASVSRKDDGYRGSAGKHPIRNGFADKGLDDDPYYAFV